MRASVGVGFTDNTACTNGSLMSRSLVLKILYGFGAFFGFVAVYNQLSEGIDPALGYWRNGRIFGVCVFIMLACAISLRDEIRNRESSLKGIWLSVVMVITLAVTAVTLEWGPRSVWTDADPCGHAKTAQDAEDCRSTVESGDGQ
jgi:heme A synthase